MPQTTLQSVLTGLAGLALTLTGISSAQAQLPNCRAPRSNEFLLLIVTPTSESQARVRSVVSRTAEVSVCSYLGQTVTRVGGYRDADTAQSWVNYLNDTVRVRAFVAVPPGASIAAQAEAPRSQQVDRLNVTPAQAFNPQRLRGGFAVIVDHNNRPEVAAQIQRVLNRNIGLASFEQRPYLLAIHTNDRATAAAILRRLNDRGFAAMLVRSDRVTLLTPVVQTDPAMGGQ
ncbi:hypothetical protein [Leptolyngbya sp. FACHB-17]|uniref:hypothetical protein n=1 Tax=unclassified Leptolyngbya TaxID=2650499 RepID=UPI00168143AD|nr:hypothetical protein [Leptolyngbya sp. FACHB-17]MBD2081173.1 hypothetical protein [Leptolyngbya sp. FACHB-17]